MPDQPARASLTETTVAPQPDAEEAPIVDRRHSAAQDAAIDAWFRDHFAGTALGATTDLYNAAFAAKDDLKKRLAAL